MKSLAELAALRQKSLNRLSIRNEVSDGGEIVVGMATCGIAAGARPVMSAFVEELHENEIIDVTVKMSGCMGQCALEPMVEVYDKDGNKTTYVHMTPEKAKRVVTEHIINGQPVAEYTMAADESRA